MSLHVGEIAIDCADPTALADFWCRVLGYGVRDADEGIVIIGGDSLPLLTFARVPEPKAGKNRLHLDLVPDDQGAEVERVLALGAQHADVGQGDADFVVLSDPEGNEFCILRGGE